MQDAVTWFLAILCGAMAIGAVALERSARAAACLIGAAAAAAGLAFLVGAGDLSVALVTTTAAGSGLLLLMVALLLNLTQEETGGRRFRIQPTLHLLVVAWVVWVAFQSAGPLGANEATALPPGSAGSALFERLGLALAMAGLALLATLLTTIVVARRSG